MTITNVNINNQLIQDYLSPEEFPLRNEIARIENIPTESILFENGADGAIRLIFQWSKNNSKSLFLPRTGYEGYKLIAKQIGYNYNVYDSYLNNHTPDDLIVICNPDNPTGEVTHFNNYLKNLKGMALIDESYIEYCPEFKTKLIDNIFIVRSFSKVFSAPGIRLGYIIASKKKIDQLKDLRLPYPIANCSLKVAEDLYKNRDFFLKKALESKYEQKKIALELSERGFKCSLSHTNFFSIDLKSENSSKELSDFVKKYQLEEKYYNDKKLLRLKFPSKNFKWKDALNSLDHSL